MLVHRHPSTSSHHHLRSHQFNSLPTTCHRQEPLPFLEGCRPNRQRPQKYRNTDPSHIRPSPLQRDVGGLTMLDGGLREGWTQGGTQVMGGSLGTSRKRTTTKVVVHIRRSSLSSADHICSTPMFRSTLAYRTSPPSLRPREFTPAQGNEGPTTKSRTTQWRGDLMKTSRARRRSNNDESIGPDRNPTSTNGPTNDDEYGSSDNPTTRRMAQQQRIAPNGDKPTSDDEYGPVDDV